MSSSPDDDKLRVLVSGAAAGTGLACAAAFAARGAELILCDTDGTGLTRASDQLGAFARYCDVLSDASVAIFAAELFANFPSIDVLINAAGTRYLRSIGMLRLSRALLPLLRKAKGRRFIVNVTPAGGFVTSDAIFPYGGSREGFDRLTEAIAEQARGTSISVVSVTPQLAHAAELGLPHGGVCRLERGNEVETAERIVAMVVAARPDWRIRYPRLDRRA